MTRCESVLNSNHFDNNILISSIKIDSQYVKNALPNIKLNLNNRTVPNPKVRKKGGCVGC
jgi:hypothetical protein